MTTFQSCGSDDDGGSQDEDTYIRFTIDGTDYEFIDIASAESLGITLNGNNGEDFFDSGDTSITIWFPINAQTGMFDVDPGISGDYQVSFTSDPLNFDFDFADSGSITLTQVTGEYFEGTFDATITNDLGVTITLQNGEFRGFTFE
ncbi:MAG: hypothetical protein WBG46_05260 [Nonlabens sp.]